MVGLFITNANEKFKDVCNLFELCDCSVNSIKRYLGETVLGYSSNGSSGASIEEDPWQTFFLLLVKFAEMYKLSILELEEWKKAELRMNRQSMTNNMSNGRSHDNKTSPHIEISQFSKENLRKVHTKVPKAAGSQNSNTSAASGKDVMEVFKERLQIIRKRNSTNFEDSDLSDDNEQSDW